MLRSGVTVVFICVALTFIEECHGRQCYGCQYILKKGTLGNYLACVTPNKLEDLAPYIIQCDNFCVTRRFVNINTDLLFWYQRGCSDVDYGNGCRQYNDTTSNCSTSCLQDGCNSQTGNPFLDNYNPTGPYLQCYKCSYGGSSGGSRDCVTSPHSVATPITGTSNGWCVTTSVYSQPGNNVVSLARTYVSTNPGVGCTTDGQGQLQCSVACQSPSFCNNVDGTTPPSGIRQPPTVAQTPPPTTTTTKRPTTTTTTPTTTTTTPTTTTTTPTTTTIRPTTTTTRPSTTKIITAKPITTFSTPISTTTKPSTTTTQSTTNKATTAIRQSQGSTRINSGQSTGVQTSIATLTGNMTTSTQPSTSEQYFLIPLIAALVVGVGFALLLIVVAVVCYCVRKRRNLPSKDKKTPIKDPATPQVDYFAQQGAQDAESSTLAKRYSRSNLFGRGESESTGPKRGAVGTPGTAPGRFDPQPFVATNQFYANASYNQETPVLRQGKGSKAKLIGNDDRMAGNDLGLGSRRVLDDNEENNKRLSTWTPRHSLFDYENAPDKQDQQNNQVSYVNASAGRNTRAK